MDETGEVPERSIPEPVWRQRLQGKVGAADSLEQARYRRTLVKEGKEKKKREIEKMLKSEPEPTLAELAEKAFGPQAVRKPEPSFQEETPKTPVRLKATQGKKDQEPQLAKKSRLFGRLRKALKPTG